MFLFLGMLFFIKETVNLNLCDSDIDIDKCRFAEKKWLMAGLKALYFILGTPKDFCFTIYYEQENFLGSAR